MVLQCGKKLRFVCPSVRNGRSAETDTQAAIHAALETRTRRSLRTAAMALATGTKAIRNRTLQQTEKRNTFEVTVSITNHSTVTKLWPVMLLEESL